MRLLTRRSVTQLKCWTLSWPISQYSMKLTRTSASRGIERHIVDKAKPMHHARGAVMPLIIGDAPGVLGCLHLLEQIGMIAFFDPENIVHP